MQAESAMITRVRRMGLRDVDDAGRAGHASGAPRARGWVLGRLVADLQRPDGTPRAV